jgi:predicted ribonuclease YlaK
MEKFQVLQKAFNAISTTDYMKINSLSSLCTPESDKHIIFITKDFSSRVTAVGITTVYGLSVAVGGLS